MQETGVNLRDVADAVLFPGMWNFLRRYRTMAWKEVIRSFSRRVFSESLQKLVLDVEQRHLAHEGSGGCAPAMLQDGTPVQDFSLVEKPNALHPVISLSRSASASLAIAEEIAKRPSGIMQ